MKKNYLLLALLAPVFSYAADVPNSNIVTGTPPALVKTQGSVVSPFKTDSVNIREKEKMTDDIIADRKLLEAQNKLKEEQAKAIEAEAKLLNAQQAVKKLKMDLNPPPAPKVKVKKTPVKVEKPAYQPLLIDAYQGDPQAPSLMGVTRVGSEYVATVVYQGSNVRVKNGSVLGGRVISNLNSTSFLWGERPVWSQAGLSGSKIVLTDLDAEKEMRMIDLANNLKAKREGKSANSPVQPVVNTTQSSPLATFQNTVKASGLPPAPPRLN